MLSGFNVQHDVREKVIASLMGQEWPSDTFMEKPVKLTELAQRIDLLLAGEEAGPKSAPEGTAEA